MQLLYQTWTVQTRPGSNIVIEAFPPLRNSYRIRKHANLILLQAIQDQVRNLGSFKIYS